MTNSYKNFERLRYNINRDLEALYEKAKNERENQRVKFIDECFSAMLSSLAGLLISLSALEPFKVCISKVSKFLFKVNPPEMIKSVLSVVLCAVVLFFVSSLLNSIVIKVKSFFRNQAPEGKDKTCYYKKFDDIACNGVMLSIDYKKMYDTITDKDEKTLYYLEILYHIKLAIETTEHLVRHKEIQTSNNVVGVDSYRVNNICNIVDKLLLFLKNENINISLEDSEKKEIGELLENHHNQLDKIKNELCEICTIH